jgi:hypothetical protein
MVKRKETVVSAVKKCLPSKKLQRWVVVKKDSTSVKKGCTIVAKAVVMKIIL